jgi:hypothetical protein
LQEGNLESDPCTLNVEVRVEDGVPLIVFAVGIELSEGTEAATDKVVLCDVVLRCGKSTRLGGVASCSVPRRDPEMEQESSEGLGRAKRRTEVDACEWAQQSVETQAKCMCLNLKTLDLKTPNPTGDMHVHVRGRAGVLQEDRSRTLS